MKLNKKKTITSLTIAFMAFAMIAPVSENTNSQIKNSTSIIQTMEASAASYNWRKGGFSGGTCWSTYQYLNSYSSKNPTVYFYSYKGNGKSATGTTMYVQIYNTQTGNCVYNYSMKNGGKVTLKNNKKQTAVYTKYKIRIKRYSRYTNAEWWGMKVNSNYGYWTY